jgi:ABC-type multidrug transport system ATPase subunit
VLKSVELVPGVSFRRGNKRNMSLVFSDLSYTVPDTRVGKDASKASITIINGVTGHVLKGEMMAVMGPSGAGKVSLNKYRVLVNT